MWDCSSARVSHYLLAAGNNHTCALTPSGAVKCWGMNHVGQLGDGTTTRRNTATQVSGLTSGVVALSAGHDHACAVNSLGGVLCWGDVPRYSEAAKTVHIPTQVPELTSGVVAISSGNHHACALTSAAEVRCWGSGSDLQLGSETAGSDVPILVPLPLGEVTGVFSGRWTTCAIIAQSGVECWGSNILRDSFPGRRDRSLEEATGPTAAPGDTSDVIAGSLAYQRACAITSAGGVRCWGASGGGSELSDVPGLESGVASVSLSLSHACVLTSAGGVRCWGNNEFGQLGDGTTETDYSTIRTTQVSGLASGVAAIAVGEDHSCAIKLDGKVWCWGDNRRGQLGGGSLPFSLAPKLVSNFP